MSKKGSDIIVESLINHEVPYIFGIPGAKIDGVFDALVDKGPELILARHEQNAAFMAQGIGRLTGEPGLVIATSGPGASNLATGLVTATAEGDPVLALAGQVKRSDLSKLTHQSMNNAALFSPITKFSTEIQDPETLSENIANAYRIAKTAKKGATFLSIPQDVTDSPVTGEAIKPLSALKLGHASAETIAALAERIKQAKLPVLLLGMRASARKVTAAIRELVAITGLPVVETFQGAGIISKELEEHFFGRVGLFRNQPGDRLLKRSDLVIAIGYDPIEYEARNWNAEKDARVIVIDEVQMEIDQYMQPEEELIGDMSKNILKLSEAFSEPILTEDAQDYLETLQEKTTNEMTVTVDVGSHYIWMARHFRSYEPRHLLFSNGMQTLGVALPWAISAALVRPNTQIISVSGDGGFLFSAQELETAVRLKQNIVHIIWNDGSYDMVKFQEEMKYNRSSGVDFGPVDFVKYAEAFGAKGVRVHSQAEFAAALEEGMQTEGPVIIDVPVDYSDNQELGKTLLPDQLY